MRQILPIRLRTALPVALLIGLGVWLRVTSLETYPEPNGDEAWYGVQVGRLLTGRSFAVCTGNGNLMNPAHILPQVPLIALFGAEPWTLRIPSLVGGLLAIVLAHRLLSRQFDPATGRIAAVLFACWPLAIFYSRVGYDISQAPLFGLLLVVAAHRARPWAVAGALSLAYLAHPTNILMLPVVTPLALWRACDTAPPGSRRRSVLRMAATLGVLGVAFYVRTRLQRQVQVMYAYEILKTYDPWLLLERYARLMLGGAGADLPRQDAAFWAVLAALFLFGGAALIHRRQWDRLALAAGLPIGLAAAFAVGGSDILRPEHNRYGLFLLAPTILSATVLSRALWLGARASRLGRGLSGVQALAGVTAALALLACYKVHYLDPARPGTTPGWHTLASFRTPPGADSPWTLRTTERGPIHRAYKLIVRDRAAHPGARQAVLAQDWWLHRPLEFLLVFRPEVRVVDTLQVHPDPARHEPILDDQVTRGAYAVVFANAPIDAHLRAAFGGRLRTWDISLPGNIPYLRVHRLRAPAPSLAQRRPTPVS